MISAFAVMLALSSPPGFRIETRTSNVVTLSFSTPSGEILVTAPSNFRSLKDSTTMRAGCREEYPADIGLVDLAQHVDIADIAQCHDQRRLRSQHENGLTQRRQLRHLSRGPARP